ncbi:hypothetical protein [Rhizobium gallicum]|uniref:hypothetical protein n=1 Tax=Rhizobium gallicum TaxID=56730 RepID=UPI00093CE463|nr:hypothetical protein [Rhizobium gallicum]
MELLARSGFAAFKKTDPYFFYQRQAVGMIGKISPQSIVDVNPFLGHALGARRAYQRVWQARHPLLAAAALHQLLINLPKVVRRSCPDIVRTISRFVPSWQIPLTSQDCPDTRRHVRCLRKRRQAGDSL